MLTKKRLLLGLAALTAAGLAGCLNSTDPTSSQFAPVTEAEIQAALRVDSLDSLAPRPRPIVCDTLKARLAAMDTAAPQYFGFSTAVAHVCRIRPPRPDSLRPDTLRPDSLRPDSLRPRPVKPDSLRPDTSRPKPDTLRPQPPVKDTVRPQPDSLRPVPPGKPDSGMVPPRTPVKPVPPKRPVKDTASDTSSAE
ncbi:MAG: hypothetical protein K0Q91_2063 [Fibrobacteria bacterium]|jgi:hypothetical protein|nr:hypothetical protein [Fibrobacteria bacterium]